MKYKVGDRVAFQRGDASVSDHACLAFGIDFINHYIFKDSKFYKGKITKVKTHFLFFFKMDKPVYLINDYYEVKNIKPIITLKAELA